MNILYVSTSDVGGGAEKEGRTLFQSSRARGHSSWLAVGRKHSTDANVLTIAGHNGSAWSRAWNRLDNQLARYEDYRGAWRARSWLRSPARLRNDLEERLGLENFDFPGTHNLLNLAPQCPDVVHAHNLHGGYFDLRALTEISRQVPVLLTLHDEWLLTGHCAYSLGCERWERGCGACPDLTIYPSVKRDATAWNWKRKRRVLAKSQLSLATPSRWLMDRVNRSGLRVVEKKVIPYGVDLETYHPGNRASARDSVGLPADAHVLLCVANLGKSNPFKDYDTIEKAARLLGEFRWARQDRQVILLVLGGDQGTEELGPVTVQHVPYQTDQSLVARYYQAADLYLHSAHADNFPCTILESLACGTPVIAPAVGGIPEQVKGLRPSNGARQIAELNHYAIGEATGLLVPAGDSKAMALGIGQLINDSALRNQLGQNAARDARIRFSLQRQVDDYLSWYTELIERHAVGLNSPSRATV